MVIATVLLRKTTHLLAHEPLRGSNFIETKETGSNEEN
jgi:hypothetical protein